MTLVLLAHADKILYCIADFMMSDVRRLLKQDRDYLQGRQWYVEGYVTQVSLSLLYTIPPSLYFILP